MIANNIFKKSMSIKIVIPAKNSEEKKLVEHLEA